MTILDILLPLAQATGNYNAPLTGPNKAARGTPVGRKQRDTAASYFTDANRLFLGSDASKARSL